MQTKMIQTTSYERFLDLVSFYSIKRNLEEAHEIEDEHGTHVAFVIVLKESIGSMDAIALGKGEVAL